MRRKHSAPPICQYCGSPILNFAVARHEPVCEENPEVRAQLLHWLPNPDCPSRIRTMDNYKEATPNSPGAEHLCNRHGGWHEVAAAFGLEPPPDMNEKRYKIKAAATEAELRRLSNVLHGGRWSPSYLEYNVWRSPGLPGSGPMMGERLVKKYGSWAAALEHYGLPPVAPPEEKNRPPDDDGRNYCTPPYWFDWRVDPDGNVTVVTVEYPVFHG